MYPCFSLKAQQILKIIYYKKKLNITELSAFKQDNSLASKHNYRGINIDYSNRTSRSHRPQKVDPDQNFIEHRSLLLYQMNHPHAKTNKNCRSDLNNGWWNSTPCRFWVMITFLWSLVRISNIIIIKLEIKLCKIYDGWN